MSFESPSGQYLHFDDLVLDLDNSEVRRDGKLIKLQTQPFKVLALLAGRSGRVVTRDEIKDEVWSEETFVDFDKGIYYCIKEIRTALGDEADHPRYVETVPKKGYRFLPSPRNRPLENADVDETACPYPGLLPFWETDANFFFGREEEIASLLRKLERRHLLALVGPSGSGKTSLIRAGLIPALPKDWSALVLRPGQAPIAALSEALSPELAGHPDSVQRLPRIEDPASASAALEPWRQRHREVLIVVDQFEELFTLNGEDDQRRFSELLGCAAQRLGAHVLLSFRDDFLMRCQELDDLDAIFTELTPLQPPKGGSLRRALVEAASRCGYRFEDESLVTEILSEVTRERGALPLLAFAAAQLWDKRDRQKRLLTREAYLEIGGVGGALAQHAEATLEKIGTNHVPRVRELFRNLVTAQGTRIARDMEELLSVFENNDAAKDVLRELIDSRLLTSFEISGSEGEEKGRNRVEITHESLLKAWPRLVRWQTQDQEGAQLRDELRQAARRWEQHSRSTDRLWTGTAVKEFQIWRERYSGGLTPTEDAFCREMVQYAERHRRRRRFTVFAGFAVLLAVVAVVSSLWRQSVAETRRAEASKLLALGQLELERYPTAAVAYAIKSLELADTREARVFALRALQRGPTAFVMDMADLIQSGGTVWKANFTGDGEWLAFGGLELVQLRSRDRDEPILVPGFPASAWTPVQTGFSPRGDRLVTLKLSKVQVWSVPDARELWSQTFEPGTTNLITASSGFFTLTTRGGEEIVRKWSFDTTTHRLVGQMEALAARKPGLEPSDPQGVDPGDIDPMGRWLVFPRGRRIVMRSLANWNLAPRLVGEHSEAIRTLRFRPGGGDEIAALDASGEIRLWLTAKDLAAPTRISEARGAGSIVFDKKGTKLAAFGMPEAISTVWLWDLSGLPEAEPLFLRRSDAAFFNGAEFDPSGQWLVTTHAQSAAFWPIDHDYPRVLKGHNGSVSDVAFTPDGKHLVSASSDRTVRVWPLESGERNRVVLREELVVPKIDIDPSGTSILVPGYPGEKVFVVPLSAGLPRILEGFTSASVVVEVAFGTEGRLAAAASYRGPRTEKVIRIWDLETGECQVLGPVEGAGGASVGGFSSLEFLSDGRLLSLGNSGLRLWNLADGKSEKLADSLDGELTLSPDGRHVLYSDDLEVGTTSHQQLTWTDLVQGKSRSLDSHGSAVFSVAFDPTGRIAVSGSNDGVVRVGPVTGEEPHLLLGHKGRIYAVAVSPDGQWIASAGDDGTIRLWPTPEGPPFHTLPYDELQDRLRSLTNVRVVEDEASSAGYRLDYAPFPGWKTVPKW